MKDPRTKEYIQLWGRKQVPVAHVIKGKIPMGDWPSYALLAWIVQREKDWPIVGTLFTVLDDELQNSIGHVSMALPLTPVTERHVCQFLEQLGWDGRVWPYKDHGWPEGTEEEAGCVNMLRTAKIGATLTFPPQPPGTPALLIPILDRSKPYSVFPFAYETPMPRRLETLRALANDPTPFKSDWG